MPIQVSCAGCGGRFNAPDHGAGKKVPCPKCKTAIVIPAHVVVDDDEEYHLAPEPQPPPRPSPPPPPQPAIPAMAPPRPASLPRPLAPLTAAVPVPLPSPATIADSASRQPAAWVPATKSSVPTWLRHLHWCLALAMIPLAISIFLPNESPEELIERVLRSLAAAEGESPLLAASTGGEGASDAFVDPATPVEPSESASTDEAVDEELLIGLLDGDLLLTLPGHRLQGAFLARDSVLHWLFALVSVGVYMTFFIYLASDRSANPLHLLGLGFFTATIGILLLLVVQVLAMIGDVGDRGIAGILALIGLSYRLALDPDSGFFTSFIGFTCGVGLCEELVKALPILIFYKFGPKQNWRGAFLWGLASGAGFGVSEGIMYSADYYNGIMGPGIYLVRFVSCVALHAVWTGSVAISINQRKYLIQEEQEYWIMYVVGVFRMIAIPMVLHGLYDTLLKKELDFLALVAAAASFGYLAWQISRLRTSDDEDERAAHVSQFIRSQIPARQQA
jgi:RsiW-degrading membrane proteinase PrsW (M82 family)